MLLELEFLKLINPGDFFNITNYDILFKNIFYIETNTTNTNIASLLINNNIINNNKYSNLFPKKQLYVLSEIYTSKDNIYSNFYGDIHCFLNSGNIFDGWLFKITFKPGVIYL